MNMQTDMRANAKPLKTMTNVPVGAAYADRVVEMLTTHGAIATVVKDCTLPTGSGHKEFAITFPDGTLQGFGAVLLRTTQFTIFFPDGFELMGQEVYPTISISELSSNIFFLPK
jgi:hypothetical protein